MSRADNGHDQEQLQLKKGVKPRGLSRLSAELRRAVNIRYYDTSAFSFTFGFEEPVVQDGVVHLAGENCKKYNANGTEYGGRNFQFVGYSTIDTCDSGGSDTHTMSVPTRAQSALRKTTGRRHADVVFERATNKLLLMR